MAHGMVVQPESLRGRPKCPWCKKGHLTTLRTDEGLTYGCTNPRCAYATFVDFAEEQAPEPIEVECGV